ncbi:hypothetical protein VTN00DRAFT_3943 [Thermoascus crustaceus]|uniref:uncharacterized protein n=1 Tax=Thermoascus crustaceus TaxID=5088 RepID=UPI003743258A
MSMKGEDIPPIDDITWDQLLAYLKAGYNPRFCESPSVAEDNIRNGVRADALAVYESFPHFIFKLNKDHKISVSDKDPFGGRVKDVHNSLYTALKFYTETLNGSAPERERAWRSVLACFERDNFTERDKQQICKEFYKSLESLSPGSDSTPKWPHWSWFERAL